MIPVLYSTVPPAEELPHLLKFANSVSGCVISNPVRSRIAPDLGLNNVQSNIFLT